MTFFITIVLQNQQHLAAVEVAIRNKGKLDHGVMQGVFVGPAGSGKSILINDF